MSEETRTPYELAAIDLMTVDGPMRGWIATEGTRTSDWLNGLERPPIHGLVSAGHGGGAEAIPLRPPATSIARDRIVWVEPPPLPPNRHLRLHRRRVRVQLEVLGTTLIGYVHVRPGADASDWVLRGTRRMLPLTEVELHPSDGGQYRVVPVLVVNTTHVRRLVADGANRAPAVQPRALAAPRPPAPSGTGVAQATEPAAAEEASHALIVLLQSGVIELAEFQELRARIVTSAG